MKVQELRSGNWIHTGEFHIKRLQGEHQYKPEWWRYCGMFSPIPITGEWLERFGFRKSAMYYDVDGLCIVKFTDGKFHVQGRESLIVEYVHTLQNLYFALTGEELTKKQQ